MNQILQSLRTGSVEIGDVPCPQASAGRLLIRTTRSLISSGTERMLLEFGRAGWIEKARQQPEKVQQAIDKARADGLQATIEALRSRLDQPLPLGYCNVGTVIAVGDGVDGFAVGDRVVSNAWHAEVVSAPATLCAVVPDPVLDEAAAFTVVSAIALQGIRLVEPALGERVAVFGLGLVGLVAVQLLRAHGCHVLGFDPVRERVALARRFGAEAVSLVPGADPLGAAASFSRGRGIDAAVIAAGTASADPVRQAARMCRQRGRIVLVGVAGLELERDAFYKKELTFQVSCSYGPGRYDPSYEEKGQDYPFGLVRWTARRNFEAVLDLLADSRLDVAPLLTHRFPVEEAERAYATLVDDRQALGILLTYGDGDAHAPTPTARTVRLAVRPSEATAVRVAVLGAGLHAQRALIPALRSAGAHLTTVVSANGVSAAYAGRRFGFAAASTDARAAIEDTDTNAVVIATRHDTHARYVLEALRSGKHVFVEKPLCLTLEELAAIEDTVARCESRSGEPGAPVLMVGFNRRFSPLARRMKDLLVDVTGPRSIVITVNAGAVPAGHWVHDPAQGGGRLVGEGCHFIDLARFLVGAPIAGAEVIVTGGTAPDDPDYVVTLRFIDGSVAAVHYLTRGHRRFPKERVEVFSGGRILQLDNFRRLRAIGWPRRMGWWQWRQDKGHDACVRAFVDGVRHGVPPPIPTDELFGVMRTTLELAGSLRTS